MSKETTTFFKLSNGTYDFLKGLVQYVLPGLATLYLGLAAFWGFPNPEAIAGSVTLLSTFLGGLIGISKRGYLAMTPTYDGDVLVDVNEEGGEDYLTLSLDRPMDEIKALDSVTFKIVRNKALTQE